MQALINNRPQWQELVIAGKFEEDKAILSTEINPARIAAIKVAKFEDLTNELTPTLATIRKYNSDIAVKAVIHRLLDSLAAQYNFKNKLTGEQKETITDLILDDYYHFTIADLKLMFKMAIKGDFGELYQNLDPSTVYGWCKEYLERRSQHIFKTRQSALNEAYKKDSGEINRRMIKIILDDIRAKEEAKKAMAAAKIANRRVFKTLENYFKSQGLDPAKESAKLLAEWEASYKEKNVPFEFDLYATAKYSEELLKVNKNL